MTTLALRFAPTAARGRSRLTFQAACAVVGVVLIAGLAQFTIYLPFTPVPITGQTLGVLLVGAAYGPALGAAPLGLYLVAAIAGLPVLARNVEGGHDVGVHVLGLGFGRRDTSGDSCSPRRSSAGSPARDGTGRSVRRSARCSSARW